MLEVSLKIQIESLGLPTLSKLIGKKSQLDMADGTLADIVARIVDRHGRPAGKILLDQQGQLDMAIQVMVNDEGFLPRSEYSQRILKDGDSVKFMLLVGGG
jgi:sulfur carrier protein ThiS